MIIISNHHLYREVATKMNLIIIDEETVTNKQDISNFMADCRYKIYNQIDPRSSDTYISRILKKIFIHNLYKIKIDLVRSQSVTQINIDIFILGKFCYHDTIYTRSTYQWEQYIKHERIV